jgi:hypothetical protein
MLDIVLFRPSFWPEAPDGSWLQEPVDLGRDVSIQPVSKSVSDFIALVTSTLHSLALQFGRREKPLATGL